MTSEAATFGGVMFGLGLVTGTAFFPNHPGLLGVLGCMAVIGFSVLYGLKH